MERFEGKVQVTNIAALKVAAAAMSDHQLEVFYKTFKFAGLREQKQTIMDEMAVRVIADALVARVLIIITN